jgi:hypothetical protein
MAAARKRLEAQGSVKRLRQAREDGGRVSVLCFACRRTADTTKQQTMASFFKPPCATTADAGAAAAANPSATSASFEEGSTDVEPLCCSKCRRVMEKRSRPASSHAGARSHSRVLPQIARIRSYQRVAEKQGVPFVISESLAAAMMREPCVACGLAAPVEGHGLTRLRTWPAGLERPARGGFMGPYHPDNLASACSFCNLAKGFRSVRGYVEACRHIATHRGGAESFGLYPHRFRNNTSRRSRSSYISASSSE